MTIEERASDALYEACEEMRDRPNAERLVVAAIREAVAEEREACAVICERVYAENRRMGLTQRPCSDEAAAIRAQHLFE